MDWTPDQIEEAHRIVNDIAEDIDNKESRKELRQALAIYADLLMVEKQEREMCWSQKLIKLLEEIHERNPCPTEHKAEAKTLPREGPPVDSGVG